MCTLPTYVIRWLKDTTRLLAYVKPIIKSSYCHTSQTNVRLFFCHWISNLIGTSCLRRLLFRSSSQLYMLLNSTLKCSCDEFSVCGIATHLYLFLGNYAWATISVVSYNNTITHEEFGLSLVRTTKLRSENCTDLWWIVLLTWHFQDQNGS